MLVGDRAFGASGFRYCGSILVGRDTVFDEAFELFAADFTTCLTEGFGLRGVNGIDFVERRGHLHPIELNPRYTASMELVERAYSLSIFDVHVRACLGELPAFDLAAARTKRGSVGKAIVYARRDVTMGDTRPWLEDDDLRDIPAPGERIARGRADPARGTATARLPRRRFVLRSPARGRGAERSCGRAARHRHVRGRGRDPRRPATRPGRRHAGRDSAASRSGRVLGRGPGRALPALRRALRGRAPGSRGAAGPQPPDGDLRGRGGPPPPGRRRRAP